MHHHLVTLLVSFALACDTSDAARAPLPSRIAVVLDSEAIRASGLYVTIELRRVDPLASEEAHLELPASGPLATTTHAFECTPGETIEVVVTASTFEGCTRHSSSDLQAVTCEPERTTAVAFGPLEFPHSTQVCFEPDTYPCVAKLDGGDFVHDPVTGERGPTAIVNARCEFDPSQQPNAALYASDLRITCGLTTIALPLAADPDFRIAAFPPIVLAGIRAADAEAFSLSEKLYFTAALLLDFEAIGRATCTASLVVALVDQPLPDDTLPTEGVFAFRVEGIIAENGDVLDSKLVLDPANHRVTADELASNPLTRIVPTTPLSP